MNRSQTPQHLCSCLIEANTTILRGIEHKNAPISYMTEYIAKKSAVNRPIAVQLSDAGI